MQVRNLSLFWTILFLVLTFDTHFCFQYRILYVKYFSARLGIVPRVAHDVFERIERRREEEESGGGDRTWYAVRCSYVQVYLDECYDLLGDHPETRSSWGARTSDVNRLYPNEESLVR